MLRDALKSVHEHSLGLPVLCARSPREAALRRRAVLARAGQLRPTWLGHGLAMVWLWLAAVPAASRLLGQLLATTPRRPPLLLYRSAVPPTAAWLLCCYPPCLAL